MSPNIVIAVDATGIKVTNRGEWRRRKGYVKIHVVVDNQDQARREPGGER